MELRSKPLPPLPIDIIRSVENRVELDYPKHEWEARKFQLLCSPNVFDLKKPDRKKWTKYETDNHRRIKNIRRWIEHFCRIRDKLGNVVPITFNHAQRRLLALIIKRWRAGLPSRVVILKPRQTGFSTAVELIIFYFVVTSETKRAAVIAHKNAISSKILTIFRTTLERLPYELPTRHRTRYEVVFDRPLDSSIDVDSAESAEPGHGDTVQYLHLTEVSRWRDADYKAKGLMQTIPDEGLTFVAWESTANGMDGYFHGLYWAAADEQNRDTNIDALFVAWFEHPEYTIATLVEGERRRIEDSLDEEEERLLKMTHFVRKKGLTRVTLEQIAWRRRTIASKCGGSLEDFHEQYPATDVEAFLSSGSPVFNIEKLLDRESVVQEPVFRGDINDSEFRPREVPDTPRSVQPEVTVEVAGPIRKHVETLAKEATGPRYVTPDQREALEEVLADYKTRDIDMDMEWTDED